LSSEDHGEYSILDNCIIDPVANTITMTITHFSSLRILYPRKVLPAMMEITELNVLPDEIVAGELVEINAVVTNTGDQVGDYEAVLKINDQLKSIKNTSIEAGDMQIISFNLPYCLPGDYVATINGVSKSFTVYEVPVTTIIPSGSSGYLREIHTPSPINSYNWSTLAILVGIALNLAIVTIATVLLCRWRLLRNYHKPAYTTKNDKRV
jgi:hypothetical protein